MRITRCSRSARARRSGSARRSATRRWRSACLSSGVSIILAMKLRSILTLILAAFAGIATAQPQPPRGDDTILEMAQAFRRNDKARLAQLLPAVRGHALEPWGAYWELRARLDTASAQEVQDF